MCTIRDVNGLSAFIRNVLSNILNIDLQSHVIVVPILYELALILSGHYQKTICWTFNETLFFGFVVIFGAFNSLGHMKTKQ